MTYDFTLPATPPLPAKIVLGTWLGGFTLFVNGKEIKRSTENGKPFLVPDAGGGTLRVDVKPGGLQFVPKVTVDGTPLEIAPPLPGWQLALALAPLVLIILGGAIGGVIAAIAASVNLQLMRSKAPAATKVWVSLLVLAGSVVLFVIAAALFAAAIKH